MQIIGPDGNPIESLEQAAQFGRPAAGGAALPLEAPRPQQSLSPAQGSLPLDGEARTNTAPAAVPIQSKAPSTTIDALEREFERKKKRELEAARAASTSSSSNGNSPRITGEKVGRNDPCPCGSGKKYKKCHGAQE